MDPETEAQIPFDFTDPRFINAYFRILHRPYERDGVDFWWIDWQQGSSSKLEGLDPLWALNHYHFLDQGETGRPLILSRYCRTAKSGHRARRPCSRPCARRCRGSTRRIRRWRRWR